MDPFLDLKRVCLYFLLIDVRPDVRIYGIYRTLKHSLETLIELRGGGFMYEGSSSGGKLMTVKGNGKVLSNLGKLT